MHLHKRQHWAIGNFLFTMTTLDGDIDAVDLETELGLDSPDSSSSDNESLTFYNQNLTRDSLQDHMDDLHMRDAQELDPSLLLLRYYKYWSLDDLSTTLGQLLKEVDQDLVELVNSHYLNFISLGKSMDGSQDLTRDIKIDLASYIKQLSKANSEITKDLDATAKLVEYKQRLVVYKRLVSTILLVNSQVETFTQLCNGLSTDSSVLSDEKLHHLAALYFSINKQYSVLLKMVASRPEIGNKQVLRDCEIVRVLSKRLGALELEFKSLLDAHLKELHKLSGHENNQRIFDVVRLYKVLEDRR